MTILEKAIMESYPRKKVYPKVWNFYANSQQNDGSFIFLQNFQPKHDFCEKAIWHGNFKYSSFILG